MTVLFWQELDELRGILVGADGCCCSVDDLFTGICP